MPAHDPLKPAARDPLKRGTRDQLKPRAATP